MKSRFPFTPFPSGWFRIAYSHELTLKKVVPLRYFGKDLVIFRTEDGTACVLDAHCPHLGAHLGYGGKVKGETIQCPFHGWCFNSKGHCTDIPYANKIPSLAQLRTWPVREINGLIFVYYHAWGEAPSWEIPDIPEYTSAEWMPFRLTYQWKLRSHIQELGEQIADIAHIPTVHLDDSVKSDLPDVDGPVWRQDFCTQRAFTTRLFNTQIKTQYSVNLYGLGYSLQKYYTKAITELRFVLLFLYTPIDEESVEVHLVSSVKKLFNKAATFAFTTLMLKDLKKEAEKDIVILEKKLYRPDPILCEGDGQILKYRRWASQFYSEVPAKTKVFVQQ
ncbi:Rieske 2Fe-2S domain-containing protein [uncultured Nostoc sp.]|uniref:Rieske 2Fe-2S domain-containing protein n=1 Tax=uncultured Nostoc sp. TaxID=340711 RepID=UPI0035CBF340